MPVIVDWDSDLYTQHKNLQEEERRIFADIAIYGEAIKVSIPGRQYRDNIAKMMSYISQINGLRHINRELVIENQALKDEISDLKREKEEVPLIDET